MRDSSRSSMMSGGGASASRNAFRSVASAPAGTRASLRSSLAPAGENRSRKRSSCLGLSANTATPRSRRASTSGPCGFSMAAAALPSGLRPRIQSAIAAKPSPLWANARSPRILPSASTTATWRVWVDQSMPAKISNCAVAFLRCGKGPAAAFANPSTGAQGREHAAGRSRGRRPGRGSPAGTRRCCVHRAAPDQPPLRPKRAELADHRRIRRGFKPSPRPVALGAPALREGWRVPRNPGSTDNRRRRSIKCSARYWASTHESTIDRPGSAPWPKTERCSPRCSTSRTWRRSNAGSCSPASGWSSAPPPLLAEERTRKRKDLIAAADLIEIRRRAERALKRRKMRKHFDLKIGTGSFSWKRKKRNIADEAALDGFCAFRTNVPEKRMSAAVVETQKRLGRVERAFRTMKPPDLHVRPIRHRREPRIRAHLLICMLVYYVEKNIRDALAPMLLDDEHGPVRDSPVAKAERSPQARRKAASKRTSSGEDVHDFRGLLEQLGTSAMNRIEPSGPGKPGFDVPASPTPIQTRTLKLLNVKIPMR